MRSVTSAPLFTLCTSLTPNTTKSHGPFLVRSIERIRRSEMMWSSTILPTVSSSRSLFSVKVRRLLVICSGTRQGCAAPNPACRRGSVRGTVARPLCLPGPSERHHRRQLRLGPPLGQTTSSPSATSDLALSHRPLLLHFRPYQRG